MRVLLILPLLLAGSSPLTDPRDAGMQAPPEGFQKTRWGMSMPEVRALYRGATLSHSGKMLSLDQPVAGRDASIGFRFAEGKLASVVVQFAVEHSNQNAYLADFSELKALLAQKYGPPPDDEEYHWSKDLFRNDPQQWGLAVAAGQLSLRTEWSTPTTHLGLVLRGDNYKLLLFLIYEGTQMADTVKAERDREKAADL